ncbi:hypothetical protein [Palaeococcus ferrophilus]|uniref:hypothetical protein n=1 Tax=Palaeococcus ferrophilus TaxID=83868 RepID=UPI00064E2443|nr:hypothetical protein [Palaeococcus ferrophilus]
MNIFIPLVLGLLIGRLFRDRLKGSVDTPMSVTLLLLIFFMGVEAGKTDINALSVLLLSVLFALLTIAGSLGFAILIGGGRE